MSNPAADKSVPADEAPDPSVLRAERRLRLLEELAEIGMELARALKLGAEAAGKDPADAFGPLSRAIRLTFSLEAKTDEELRDLKAGIVRAREEEPARAAQRQRVAVETAVKEAQARQWSIPGLVIEAAEAEGEFDDAKALEDFIDALEERLEHDDAYTNCDLRPLRETVERLCHDLCLTPDWSRWDGEEWAADYIPLRPPYSPFNQPSRIRLLDDKGEPLVTAPPGESFHHLE